MPAPEIRQRGVAPRGHEIVFSVPVTATIASDVEFHDALSQRLEGPAFDAMQRALEEGFQYLAERYPSEQWRLGELSIDSRRLEPHEAREEHDDGTA